MSELLNALQAASNTAAGTVSGPVDLLAWALRKAGVPVPQDAAGSSEWMRRQGLMADVKPGVSQMVGDTVGLLSPIAAAAYGPQIARGLLKGGENLAQPRTLNPETGAIVWHGSPHKFDKFDSSKIGTGEGNQVYGHGLYLADSPKVAKTYRDLNPTVQPSPERVFKGVELTPGTPEYHAATLLDGMGLQQARRTVAGWIKDADPRMAKEAEGWAKTLETLNAATSKADFKTVRGGSMYKVDLPDDAIAKMLDWDRPLGEQAQSVQEALTKSGLVKAPEETNRLYVEAAKAAFDANPTKANLDAYHKTLNSSRQPTGKEVYRSVQEMMIKSGKPEPAAIKAVQAAEALRKAGIPGVRYLDGNSRSVGQGSRNYVLFPGEEGILKILERNGQGLLGN